MAAVIQVLPSYNRLGYTVEVEKNGRQLDCHTFSNDDGRSLTEVRALCRKTAVEMAQEHGLTAKDFDLYREDVEQDYVRKCPKKIPRVSGHI